MGKLSFLKPKYELHDTVGKFILLKAGNEMNVTNEVSVNVEPLSTSISRSTAKTQS
jgi:hypothetical protein